MTVEIVENNPEVGSLRIRQTVTVPAGLSADRLGRSAETVKLPITSTVTLKKGVRRAEFVTEIDNIARDHRLRVAFPTDCESDTAYCGQPFDITVRPVQPENVNYMGDGEYEPYVGYHPMQDLCGITDGKRGAAVAAGLLEYEVLPMRRTLALTLLRATDRLLGRCACDRLGICPPGSAASEKNDLPLLVYPPHGRIRKRAPRSRCGAAILSLPSKRTSLRSRVCRITGNRHRFFRSLQAS